MLNQTASPEVGIALEEQNSAGKAPQTEAYQVTKKAENDVCKKTFFSYSDIHKTICGLVPQLQAWCPDVMVAIGGGGFIPARMLRTQLKIPILAVSLELYDDETKTTRKTVVKKQWFDETLAFGNLVRNKRVLIVDEVDDTRTTLQYCAEEIIKNHSPDALAVCVVHNKIKPKKGNLMNISRNDQISPALLVKSGCSEESSESGSAIDKIISCEESSADDNNSNYFPIRYFAGAHVEDGWNCYPWDAAAYGNDIDTHEKLSKRT